MRTRRHVCAHAVCLSCQLLLTLCEQTLRDGVLGLGPGFQGSVWNSSSVLARLLDAGHASPRFALCLRDHGGALLLGTTPPPSRLVRLPRSPLASRSYFSVSLQALYVESELVTDDAELLNGRYGGAVFDLGVSPLILPRKVFDEVAYYVHRYVCAKNNVSVACYAVNNLFAGKCENLPQSDLALFPVLAFNVSGLPFALVLRPNEYIVSGATCRVVMLSPTGACAVCLLTRAAHFLARLGVHTLWQRLASPLPRTVRLRRRQHRARLARRLRRAL